MNYIFQEPPLSKYLYEHDDRLLLVGPPTGRISTTWKHCFISTLYYDIFLHHHHEMVVWSNVSCEYSEAREWKVC
jgi:hypothetical protein